MTNNKEMQKGFFGEFGGAYIPDMLKDAINEVAENYERLKNNEEFKAELAYYHKQYSGRPSPLYFAKNLTEFLGGAKIYLKREDLNHTGAHKINHCLGQALLAKRIGKKRIIAETGAGQHGVATATVSALMGFDCSIYQGAIDIQRQSSNALRIKLLGGKLVAVERGTKTLKDAVDAALEDFSKNYKDTYYLIGSVVGPHPYPAMVRDFQSVISIESRQQIKEIERKLPDAIIACVGGGSNAIGSFYNFINDKNVKLIGVEPAGKGLNTPEHAAPLSKGTPGIIHGMKTIVMQDNEGNVLPSYSIAAGLDYPGVGPEHARLQQTKRAEYVAVTDNEALEAFKILCAKEGIIPALESSHALAQAVKVAPTMKKDEVIIVNLSGRGDKDINFVAEKLSLL